MVKGIEGEVFVTSSKQKKIIFEVMREVVGCTGISRTYLLILSPLIFNIMSGESNILLWERMVSRNGKVKHCFYTHIMMCVCWRAVNKT